MPTFLEKYTAKKIAKGTKRAMTVSCITMRQQFPGLKLQSDYVKLALEQRPNWKRNTESNFVYAGEHEITIEDKDSIIRVVEKVYHTEMYWNYFKILPITERLELIGVGLNKIS